MEPDVLSLFRELLQNILDVVVPEEPVNCKYHLKATFYWKNCSRLASQGIVKAIYWEEVGP